jgi:hypothetical protein
LVAKPGKAIVEVGFEGELQELMGFAATAFPSVDECHGLGTNHRSGRYSVWFARGSGHAYIGKVVRTDHGQGQ